MGTSALYANGRAHVMTGYAAQSNYGQTLELSAPKLRCMNAS